METRKEHAIRLGNKFCERCQKVYTPSSGRQRFCGSFNGKRGCSWERAVEIMCAKRKDRYHTNPQFRESNLQYLRKWREKNPNYQKDWQAKNKEWVKHYK